MTRRVRCHLASDAPERVVSPDVGLPFSFARSRIRSHSRASRT